MPSITKFLPGRKRPAAPREVTSRGAEAPRRQRRRAEASATVPLRRVDRTMELVGIALLPIGITVILLGWMGAARTGLVFAQIPYLISGGLLGVGLLMASGFVYFASWISRSAAAQRDHHRELVEAVRALQTQLALRPVTAPDGTAGTNGSGSAAFLATPSGTMFHRPDCAIVAGRQDTREVTGDEAGMRPCGMCDPLASQQTALN
jgi:hypothetical protein